jgi:hypothetical protein
VAALETLLKPFSRKGNEVTITGANLHIVNGLGSTDCTNKEGNPIPDCPNGLGNLIVGYNELRQEDPDCPSLFGICTDTRTGSHNVVVGKENTASGPNSAVSGGRDNAADGVLSAVGGGRDNIASGYASSVSGGLNNTAGGNPTVSGGHTAVSGGRDITQDTDFGWAAGSEGIEVFVGNFRSP